MTTPIKWRAPGGRLPLVLLASLVLLYPAVAVEESEILRQLDKLKAIQPTKDKKKLADLNARMDSAWQFLETHKAESAPIVMRELARELEKPVVDQFFVLDVGKLALSLKGKESEAVALKALAKIAPGAEIIQWNFQELFDFTHALAKLGSPEILAQTDRLFLTNETKLEFFQAPHVVKLNAMEICLFLYGSTGANAEEHLLKSLEKTPGTRRCVLEILCALGSERSVVPVQKLMASATDYETFTRCVKFMMTLGGPDGKAAVLALDASHLDPKSKAYHKRILPEVKRVSAESLGAAVKRLDETGGGKEIADDELKRRLKKMYDNFGVDNDTSPSALISSKLPRDYLIDQLKKIRSRMFFRANNHALEDVEITNLVINTLQFSR